MEQRPINRKVVIGHVHLKVADLERSLGFYRDVLGFQVMQGYGRDAVFISAGGYHHHIGLNTWESRGGSPPPPGSWRCTPTRWTWRRCSPKPSRPVADPLT